MLQRITIRNAILVVVGWGLVLRSLSPSLFMEVSTANDEVTRLQAILHQQQQAQLRNPTSRVQASASNPLETNNHQLIPADSISTNSEFPYFIEDYIRFHQQTKGTRDARYLVWRCPLSTSCGGTGDRIKGILTAFYTAVCTRRVLLLDWPLKEQRDMSSFLAPHRIDWRIPEQLWQLIATNSLPFYSAVDNYNNPWFKQLSVPLDKQQAVLIDMRCNLWSEHVKAVVRVNDTDCLQQLWQQEPPLHASSRSVPPPHYTQTKYLFRTGFWTMFTFGNAVHNRKRDMQQKANLLQYASSSESTGSAVITMRRRRLQQQQQAKIDAEQHSTTRRLQEPPPPQEVPYSTLAGAQTKIQPYVAVHIRTGIGSSWKDPVRHGSNEDYQKFYQCAKRLQQGIYQRQRQHHCQTTVFDYQKPLPLLPIFVAADNKIAKTALMQLDQQQQSANNQTVRVLQDMEIYHIDRSSKQGNHAENTVWGELNVLLESTCLVASRSGFSDLATWLQPTPNGKRCAIMYNKCDDDSAVHEALDALDFSSCGGGS